MSHARAFITGAVLAVVAATSAARADVVDRPPKNCPPGSHGETGHAGPYCAPSSCTSDAECSTYGTGLVCKEQPLCIEKKSYTDWRGTTYTRDEVQGVCDAAGCTAPAICTAGTRCVPSTPGATSGGATSGGSGGGSGSAAGGGEADGGEDKVVESGCGCSIPSGRGPAAALVLAVVAASAAFARRSRRRGA